MKSGFTFSEGYFVKRGLPLCFSVTVWPLSRLVENQPFGLEPRFHFITTKLCLVADLLHLSLINC